MSRSIMEGKAERFDVDAVALVERDDSQQFP